MARLWFLIVICLCLAVPAMAAPADERVGQFRVGSGIGFAAGGGLTGFDFGLRADYHFLHFLGAGLFFDLLVDGGNVAGVVGPRAITTFNLPEVTDKLELNSGIGVGYFMFEDAFGSFDDDVIVQILLGADYDLTERFTIGTEMGFNIVVNLEEFVFNWLPVMVRYRF